MADKKKPVAASAQSGSLLDVEALRQIVEILESSEVTRLDWNAGTERLSIRRGPHQPTQVVHQMSAMPAAPAVSVVPYAGRPRASAPARPTSPPVVETEKKGHVITSPFVGTFYRSPAPDQPSFVEVGGMVKKGQVLCIIEAMKLMNEIESEVGGRVAEILAPNAQPVEFGQPLFRIEPA